MSGIQAVPVYEYADPAQFGGDPTGVADSTNAFALAMTTGKPISIAATANFRIKDLTVAANSNCPGIYSYGGKITPASGSTSSTILITVARSDFFVRGVFFDMPISLDPAVAPACDRALYFRNDLAASYRWRVEGCRFGGGKFGHGMAGDITNVYVLYNIYDFVWAEAFFVDAPKVFIIRGNQVADCAINSVAAGGIRLGSTAQNTVIEAGILAENIVSRCGAGITQEGIDLLCAAARLLLIIGNTIDGCENGGFELKTSGSSLSPDVYQQILVANNNIRMTGTAGIGIALNLTGSPAAGKASNVTLSGNTVWGDTMPVAGGTRHGVQVLAYADVSILGNTIRNIDKGIILPATLGGATATRITIAGNTIDVLGKAIHGGNTATIENLVIANNPLIRSAGRAICFDAPTVNNLTISDNGRIESTGDVAIELRDTHDSLVARNTLIGTGGVLAQGTACTNVKFSRNDVAASSGNAFQITTGTGLKVLNNDVTLLDAKRVVAGAGTYVSADNVRGTVTADPSATLAGSLGDIVLNSAPASGGFEAWLCTAAGDAAAATYKGARAIA